MGNVRVNRKTGGLKEENGSGLRSKEGEQTRAIRRLGSCFQVKDSEAILEFLKNTSVGRIKEGVLVGRT